MASIGYLIRVELKKHLGNAPGEQKSCLVLPPADCTLNLAEAAEKAFTIVADAVHDISRYPVMEQVQQRRISIADLRSFRNSILLEKEGWKCFNVVT